MKKMKWAAMFAAAVAMLGFTSCLNSDDDNSNYPGYEYVQITSSIGIYSFRNASGYTLTPTNQGALSNVNFGSARYAVMSYQYNPDSINNVTHTVDITVTGLAPVETYRNLYNESEVTSFANAPFYAVGVDSYAAPYFDKNTLFILAAYYAKLDSDGDLDEPSTNHTFGLYYDANAEPEAMYSDDLVMTLYHHVTDTNLNKERTQFTSKYLHFDISSAVAAYQSKNGELPDQIVIKYKTPDTSMGGTDYEKLLDYDNAKDATNPLQIPYQRYFAEDSNSSTNN